MKKFISAVLIFCLVLSTMLFAGCDLDKEQSNNSTNINVVAFGDSISAGYAPQNTDLYQYYHHYEIGRTKINEKCYTNIAVNNLITEEVTVRVKSYAQSGDTTEDLVEKFNNRKDYPDLLTDISRANIITLCIGANNVLSPALSNITAYMTGAMSLEEYEQELQAGYNKFKSDYTNGIMEVLTRSNAKIYVMTIYDPYKYANLAEVTVDGSYYFDITDYKVGFDTLKELAIEYLQKINNYIKTQIFDNVVVVDVNQSFENLSKSQYSTYLNVDTTKIVLNIRNQFDILNLQNTLLGSVYLDPHPTLAGQEYIASLFLQKININL